MVAIGWDFQGDIAMAEQERSETAMLLKEILETLQRIDKNIDAIKSQPAGFGRRVANMANSIPRPPGL